MKNHSIALLLLLLWTSVHVLEASTDNISLNGSWKFKAPVNLEYGTYNTIAQPFQDSDWDNLRVPCNWDVINEYSDFIGEAAYSRTFSIPEDWSGNELFIYFEAVYQEAKVFINGNYLGKHCGGYTPFDFCITDFINYGKTNHILVLADNSVSRGAWWSWGGISRDVYIKRHTHARINNFHISATPDFESGYTSISVNGSIENLRAEKHDMKIEIRFDDPDLKQITRTVRISESATDKFENKFTVSNELLKLWHFDSPNLYKATLSISDEVESVDSKDTRFGVRKIEIKNTQLLLNNKPVRAFGFNRIADHRAYGSTEPIELIKKDIDNMKSLGCVITRMMHVPLSPELLNYCDEKGMLIIQEIPVWGKFDPNSFGDNPVAKQWMKEMITRDYNHPCIIGWSVANEIGVDLNWMEMRVSREQYRYVKSMFDYVRSELDNTRLLTYASFTAFRERADKNIDPAGLGDFICINSYGDMLKNCKDVHAKWNDKPIFITEFGRGQVGENTNTSDLNPIVPQIMEETQKLPYVIGASLWSYNDYRSRYRATPFSGNRSWGVVDVWRNPKIATETIHEMFSAVKDFNVRRDNDKITVTFKSRTKNEIPSYELSGYKIIVENNDGKACEKQLPLILSNGLDIKAELSVSKAILSGNFIIVKLVSPTNIAIEERKISLKKLKIPQAIYAMHDDKKFQAEFAPVKGASNYSLTYNGKEIKLISPKIEYPLDSLSETHTITLTVSDDAGNRSKSKSIHLTKYAKVLPPVIKAVTKTENGYTTGYLSEEGDLCYEIEYTTEKGVSVLRSELKSSCMIRTHDNITSIRIRKTGEKGISDWSYPYYTN